MNKKTAVLITGSNGGIGRALCGEFMNAGYIVIGVDRYKNSEVECDLYLSLDLIDFCQNGDVQQKLFDSVHQFLNDKKAFLTGLINNAAYQIVKSLDALSVLEFRDSHNVNVIAPFVMVKLFKRLLAKSEGSVVNIGSVHAKLTKPGFSAYSTSKAALSGLTRALAIDLGGCITVNTILPGATNTEMLRAGFRGCPEKYEDLKSYHPVGRIAEPVEIARLALFLCSDEARFITGAEISIDGGIGVRLHDPV